MGQPVIDTDKLTTAEKSALIADIVIKASPRELVDIFDDAGQMVDDSSCAQSETRKVALVRAVLTFEELY